MGRLQRGNDPECRLFQKIAEQGHYAGRQEPTPTRQGIYFAAPGGVLLASINTNEANRIKNTMKKALRKWNDLSSSERYLEKNPATRTAQVDRWESLYPEDGLVLKVNSRDMPRKNPPEGWKKDAWNQDFAWFRNNEMKQFVPNKKAEGETRNVPEPLVHRLVRFHLVDNVRGQTPPYPKKSIKKAHLKSTVKKWRKNKLFLWFEGKTKTFVKGKWPVCGFRDMKNPKKQTRGFEATLMGKAVYNRLKKQFETFELIAVGTRHGGTQYNGRCHDLKPAPMGIVFTLADGDNPAHRVAPAHIWGYGWKK